MRSDFAAPGCCPSDSWVTRNKHKDGDCDHCLSRECDGTLKIYSGGRFSELVWSHRCGRYRSRGKACAGYLSVGVGITWIVGSAWPCVGRFWKWVEGCLGGGQDSNGARLVLSDLGELSQPYEVLAGSIQNEGLINVRALARLNS